jgi:hypothetical protein
MSKGFGNGEGIKSRNSDWKIKSKFFLTEEEKRRYRVVKNEFYNSELFGGSHKSGVEQELIKNLFK